MKNKFSVTWITCGDPKGGGDKQNLSLRFFLLRPRLKIELFDGGTEEKTALRRKDFVCRDDWITCGDPKGGGDKQNRFADAIFF